MIRKADENDISQLSKLFRQLHEHHINIAPDSHRMPFEGYFEMKLRTLFEEDMQIFTEELDGALLSYAAVSIFERECAERTYAKILYIKHFTVAEEARRQGCGKRLFEFLKNYAKENGCDHIQLGAAANNTEALSFYESMGMTPRTIRLELKLT